MILPPSWETVLETFRSAFVRRGTFTLFCVLATGMVAQRSRRRVVGMLAARLIVDRLLAADEPIIVVVDETLFKRWGRKVHHVFWTHDGAAQGPNKIAGGNRWAVAGIVVRLPLCTAPGVPAGAVSAVGGQGHRQVGRAGRAAAGPDRGRVPAAAGARGR